MTTILLAAFLTVGGIALLVAGYVMGEHDGYKRAWADVARAHREAEMENHQWPER